MHDPSSALTYVTSQTRCVVTAPAVIAFSVCVSDNHARASEHITATVDGVPIEIERVEDRHQGILQVVRPGIGQLEVNYAAQVGVGAPLSARPNELWEYIRPSRYAESDDLMPVANELFRGLEGEALALGVGDWVNRNISYVPGSSKPTESAVDTFLQRAGVCRDFANLTCALLRARNTPARLVSVYAPQLQPMDFHAVTEVYVNGAWRILDSTRLAPRTSMVRIATGRDSADTAFMTVTAGQADLVAVNVSAEKSNIASDEYGTLVSLE